MKRSDEITVAYAKLLDRIMPTERNERYEDPLQEALELRGFGEITGGGTMQQKNGEIEYCGIDLSLTDLEESVPFVCRLLEERGAAKGSRLEISTDAKNERVVPFGVVEGIGIYFDGVNLPDEVYLKCYVNVLIEEFSRLLEGEGEIRGHWQGPTETALYLYGGSGAKMWELLAEYMESYPLCRGARVMPI